MATNPSRAKSWLLTSALIAGGVIGGAGIAHAATDSSSDSSASSASSGAADSTTGSAPAPGVDPSTMTNGPGETLLTGTEAERATAAAKAAIPDGTVIRVETDSGGATYEAHVKKADGTIVTLQLDGTFSVTGTVDGFGAGPRASASQSAPGQSASPSTSGTAA